jgi:hypothetical protein
MANVQAAFGFRHIGFLPGYSPDYQQLTRQIQSANATKIFMGDPVVKVATSSYIMQAASAYTTTPLEGIFVGCNYIPSGGQLTLQPSPFWVGAAAADATGYLINAPGALFLAAALNTAIVTSNIGQTIGFSIGTGSTSGGGFSGATLDQNTITTNAGSAALLPFQIVSLYQGIGNGSDPSTAYNWAVVTFNNQRFRALTSVA